MLIGKRILLIIGGGIAAYKSLDLIRRLRERGAIVTPVMTKAAGQFVTPLSVAALAGEKLYQNLFDLTDEADMGHIELSRSADLLLVAPATADLMAKMAHGHANDLASTVLLATDTPVIVAPAMNVRMWQHPATQRNIASLQADGIDFVGPDDGDMACGEYGPGRMSEPLAIVAAVSAKLAVGPLLGKRIVLTSGPTHEPIDPVRYIANRSSGRQGSALAVALAALGAEVVFVTGPAQMASPVGVQVVPVETAQQMLEAVEAALPADAVVCAAAVADWRITTPAEHKMQKQEGTMPQLAFTENPDILARISQRGKDRPQLVVGFAAETDNLLENATAKRQRKACDWIVANDVSSATGIMGGEENAVTLITDAGVETWPREPKSQVATRLAQRMAETLKS